MHDAEQAQIQKRKHDDITMEEKEIIISKKFKLVTPPRLLPRPEKLPGNGDAWTVTKEVLLSSTEWINDVYEKIFLTITSPEAASPHPNNPCFLTVWLARERATKLSVSGEELYTNNNFILNVQNSTD